MRAAGSEGVGSYGWRQPSSTVGRRVSALRSPRRWPVAFTVRTTVRVERVGEVGREAEFFGADDGARAEPDPAR